MTESQHYAATTMTDPTSPNHDLLDAIDFNSRDELPEFPEFSRNPRLDQAALIKTMGQRLRDAREMAGMSQMEAARRLGYANSSKLAKIEYASDTMSIPLVTLFRASRLYDCSVDWLFGASDDVEPSVAREVNAWLMHQWEIARLRDISALHRLQSRIKAVYQHVDALVVGATETSDALRAVRVRSPVRPRPSTRRRRCWPNSSTSRRSRSWRCWRLRNSNQLNYQEKIMTFEQAYSIRELAAACKNTLAVLAEMPDDDFVFLAASMAEADNPLTAESVINTLEAMDVSPEHRHECRPRCANASVQAAMKRDGFKSEWKWAESGGMTRFLDDSANWKNGMSKDKYLASADAQDSAFKANSDQAYAALVKSGKIVPGVTSQAETAGLLKARHIAGLGGAVAVANGGEGAKDANGTSARKYYNDVAHDSHGFINAFSSPAVPAAIVSAKSPSIPSTPTVPTVADAPPVIDPLASNNGRTQAPQQTSPDVSQDMKDRRIAHIVTGGLSA